MSEGTSPEGKSETALSPRIAPAAASQTHAVSFAVSIVPSQFLRACAITAPDSSSCFELPSSSSDFKLGRFQTKREQTLQPHRTCSRDHGCTGKRRPQETILCTVMWASVQIMSDALTSAGSPISAGHLPHGRCCTPRYVSCDVRGRCRVSSMPVKARPRRVCCSWKAPASLGCMVTNLGVLACKSHITQLLARATHALPCRLMVPVQMRQALKLQKQ